MGMHPAKRCIAHGPRHPLPSTCASLCASPLPPATLQPGLALVVGTLLLGWLGVRRWRGARALPGQGQPEVGADAQPEVGADAQPEPELGAVSSLFRQGQVFLWVSLGRRAGIHGR